MRLNSTYDLAAQLFKIISESGYKKTKTAAGKRIIDCSKKASALSDIGDKFIKEKKVCR